MKIRSVFSAFENEVGAVGAAKALHLLAPQFFPLWDRKIARAYGLPIGKKGSNDEKYWNFVRIAERQCLDHAGCQNPLKRIDEFNYCEYTTNWFTRPPSPRNAVKRR